jgi:hypothetical protein
VLTWAVLFALAPSSLSAGQTAVEIAFRGEIRSDWEVLPEQGFIRARRGEIFDAGIKVRNTSDREVIAMILTEIGPPAVTNHLIHLGCGPTLTVILKPGEAATVPVSYLVAEGTPREAESLQVSYAVYSFQPLKRDPREAGREIYAMRCVACHGALGRGDGPIGRLLNPAVGDFTPALRSKADGEILAAIAIGVGPMPAFAPVLGDAEQRALLRYLRSLP